MYNYTSKELLRDKMHKVRIVILHRNSVAL